MGDFLDQAEKRRIWSWAIYDWANSAFATTIMAGFFPVFFQKYWSAGIDPIVTTTRLGTTISISSLVMACLSPTLGVIADLKGYKKIFCFLFTALGVFACLWLGFIPAGDWENAMWAYGLGLMGFNAACVFYESLLPHVAKPRDMDYASALGYSLGYLGGGVLFLLNVVMYLKPALFGLSDGVEAVRVAFLSVAVWWALFSIPLFRRIPEPPFQISSQGVWQLARQSLVRFQQTARSLRVNRNLLIFMVSYWLYIDGVYTVMTMAVDYGVAIGLESSDLMTALLLTQFIGFPCAYYFGILTRRWGSKKPILFCIGLYSMAVVAATWMSQAWHFYALAVMIGMVQGGVQSLSRSLFGRMIPKDESGEYFGFFNLVGRFASILGPLVVAVGVSVTGNSRWGLMGLLVLFVLGGGLLLKVQEPRSESFLT